MQAEIFTTRGDEPLRVLSLGKSKSTLDIELETDANSSEGSGVRGIVALMLFEPLINKAGISKDP